MIMISTRRIRLMTAHTTQIEINSHSAAYGSGVSKEVQANTNARHGPDRACISLLRKSNKLGRNIILVKTIRPSRLIVVELGAAGLMYHQLCFSPVASRSGFHQIQ
jgi:hypothetical protein